MDTGVTLVKCDPEARYQVPLNEEDWKILEGLASYLQLIADVTQSDVFIDCPTANPDVALVVAEAKPRTNRSLYKEKVSGQPAIRFNEPGVLEALEKGKPSLGTRGVSQEGVFINQNVVPIFNKENRVIGVLIMERDVSDVVKKEKQVQLLEETTELLTETLIQVAVESGTLPRALHDGLLIVNKEGIIVYANPAAQRLGDILVSSPNRTLQSEGCHISETELCNIVMVDERGEKRVSEEYRTYEYVLSDRIINVSWVPLFRGGFIGGIVLIRDITDVRKKEKELMVKTAVIREIHHRVKNNLQNIVSLLRLQMRREQSEYVKEALSACINRILSIASVHEQLSQSGLERVDLHQTIHVILERIVQVEHELFSCPIEVELYGDTISIPAHYASTLALIVCELVQNAVKHSFHNGGQNLDRLKIVVYTKVIGDCFELQVIDNGIGLPRDFEVSKNSRLGLQLVDVLVKESLKGVFQIASIPEGGVRCTVTFHLNEALKEYT